MKKRFALFLMLILPLMAGCLTNSGDDDDKDNNGSGSGANVSAADYLPLKTGTIYTYNETNTYGDSEEPDVDTYTSTIGNQVVKNGKSYYQMADQYDGWSDTTYVRIGDNILYVLETFYDMYAKQVAKVGMEIPKRADEIIPVVEVPFLNFGASTWTVYTNSVTTEYGSSNISWTGKYVGRETVTVPAGTFQNCVVFELTLNDDSVYQYSGISYTIASETKMKIWCASGVGWVKTHSVYEFDDGTDTTHGNDVTISELTSYSIPQ